MSVKKGPANLSRKPSKTEERMLAQSRKDNLTPMWEQFPGLADDLPTKAAEYISLNAQIKECESRKEELKLEIEAIRLACQEEAISGDFFVVERVKSHSPKKLSADKLVEHGVELDVIDECYVGGTEYEYTQVRLRQEG